MTIPDIITIAVGGIAILGLIGYLVLRHIGKQVDKMDYGD